MLICAIVEGRGPAPTVGICFLSRETCQCLLVEFSDTSLYDRTLQEVVMLQPSIALVPDTAFSPIKSKLVCLLGEHCPGTRIEAVPRSWFDENAALEHLARVDQGPHLSAVASRFFCLSSFAAATRHDHAEISGFSVEFKSANDLMAIDVRTMLCLDLIGHVTLQDTFGRPLGRYAERQMRRFLLQPLVERQAIERRRDAVAELVADSSALTALARGLALPDVDAVLHTVGRGLDKDEAHLSSLLALRSFLTQTAQVASLIPSQSSTWLELREQLCNADLKVVRDHLDRTVVDNPPAGKGPLGRRLEVCYAIRAGVNGMLDVARKTYKESLDDAVQLASDASDTTGRPVDLKWIAQADHFVFVSRAAMQGAFSIRRRGQGMQFLTPALQRQNVRIRSSFAAAMALSQQSARNILAECLARLDCLLRAAEAIGTLAVLTSLALRAREWQWSKPVSDSVLAVRQGRHAILEYLEPRSVAPNDALLQPGELQFVTGCNMSGKTTYLTQQALTVLLAHSGSFVPAAYAAVPEVDAVYCCAPREVGDELERSSFFGEMRELASVLQRATPASLVLLDELGRSTSLRDGAAIIVSVCEAMVELGCRTLFATHSTQIAGMMLQLPEVSNVELGSTLEGDRLHMDFRLRVADDRDVPRYGLTLAKATGLSPKLCRRGEALAEALEARLGAGQQRAKCSEMAIRSHNLSTFRRSLTQVVSDGPNQNGLVEQLLSLQNDLLETLLGS